MSMIEIVIDIGCSREPFFEALNIIMKYDVSLPITEPWNYSIHQQDLFQVC
jgi:hypothetical protein